MSATPWAYYANHLGRIASGDGRYVHHSTLRALHHERLVDARYRNLTPAGEALLLEAQDNIAAGRGWRPAEVPE